MQKQQVCRQTRMGDETCDHVKHPTFDGEDESWPFCKKKMESCLARLDLTELLDETTKIPKDSETGSSDTEKAEILKLKQKNRKAAGAVLNSISSDTDA